MLEILLCRILGWHKPPVRGSILWWFGGDASDRCSRCGKKILRDSQGIFTIHSKEGIAMHYKDGTQAQLGDTVRGFGYNVKHEIQGVVVGLTPGSDTCNIQIAYAKPADEFHVGMVYRTHSHAVDQPPTQTLVDLGIEYGEARAFTLIDGPPR